MNDNDNKINIDWDDFHGDVEVLACGILGMSKDYNKIVAISRGGLIPAGILAYELGIDNVQVIGVSSYNSDNSQKTTPVLNVLGVGEVDENTLIVDDLSDTGNTCRLLKEMYPQATLAVVYVKSKGKDSPDLYVKEVEDRWVVFPWDI